MSNGFIKNGGWFWFVVSVWVASPFVLEGVMITRGHKTISERIAPPSQKHPWWYGFACLQLGTIAGWLVFHFQNLIAKDLGE